MTNRDNFDWISSLRYTFRMYKDDDVNFITLFQTKCAILVLLGLEFERVIIRDAILFKYPNFSKSMEVTFEIYAHVAEYLFRKEINEKMVDLQKESFDCYIKSSKNYITAKDFDRVSSFFLYLKYLIMTLFLFHFRYYIRFFLHFADQYYISTQLIIFILTK